MQIVIENIEQFKVFFDVIYDMSSELVELQLFHDRMVCAMLDRTKTRFFHIEYDVSFFEDYIIDDVSSVVVFLEDLHKLLKLTNKSDTLMLEISDEHLVGKVISKTGNTRLFEFVLPSDFVDSPTPPHADFPSVFEVDVGDLKQSAKDIKLIGSDLYTFVVNNDSLTIMTNNELATKYANTIDINPIKGVDMVVSASFSLDYVAQMLKFEKISKKVSIKIGSDMPIFYTFKDTIMGVSVNGMIAPRISEE